MGYTVQDVINYIYEEDVKFVRLAFCDIFGNQKNITILPSETQRAFEYGIAFDASSVSGFGEENASDLFLKPDPDTLTLLPWRPEHGRVVRMFCDIIYPNGEIFECDSRNILKSAIKKAKECGVEFSFGPELEFYLFKLDENGDKTLVPYDTARYMDVAPFDKGENVRREVCLALEHMNISPECAHHEEGPGQNEIDFRYSDALSSADNAITFKSVVETVASINGVSADFSPKPLSGESGNGFHINMSANKAGQEVKLENIIAGILLHIKDITALLNPSQDSYKRLGEMKAPKFITWSKENRSQLVRCPAAFGQFKRIELRSPDPTANPYLAFAVLIHSALDGIENNLSAPEPTNINLFSATESEIKNLDTLPRSLDGAKSVMAKSEFVGKILPKKLIENYTK